LLLANA